MAEPPVRRTVLRDYFVPGKARLAVLVEWEGEPSSRGVAYRIGNRIVKANNDVVGVLSGLPGQFRDNWRQLRDPLQRQLLARALVDDALLTGRRRKALFSLLFWTALVVWGLAGFVLAATSRDAYVTYQSGYSLFFYSLATSLFLPTPFEILLSTAVRDLGVFWTVLIAAVAKVIGSWLVLLMGDKANAGMTSLLERRPTLAKLFKAVERFAQRYGYFAIFVIFAIPFMSDTAPLFILAVLRLKKLPFLTVTFIAIVVRSLIYLYAWSAIQAIF